MGANRKSRCKTHIHTPKNAGKTCHICSGNASRTARKVEKGQGETVLVCRNCCESNDL